jgi:hypothetical protein
MNILKLNELRISYKEDATLMILEIKLWSTLLSVIHVKEIRFREINNMMK